MKLSNQDLAQVDDKTIEKLSHDHLKVFSKSLLADLKEAMDRINQNSSNSSRPPSSMAPWEGSGKEEGDEKDSDDDAEDENSDGHEVREETSDQETSGQAEAPASSVSDKNFSQQVQSDKVGVEPQPGKPVKRGAGKQRGAAGYGRTQHLEVTEIVDHMVSACAVCGSFCHEGQAQRAYTAWYSIDVAESRPGYLRIALTNTKHVLYESDCSCGHHNRVHPHTVAPDALWPKTPVGEWRLVGARFASMIVLLSKKYRSSRARIREFLLEFFGLELSIGTIDNAIREAGRSAAPLEAELIKRWLRSLQKIYESSALLGSHHPQDARSIGVL